MAAQQLKPFAQRLGLDWDVALGSDGAPVLDGDSSEALASSYQAVELSLGEDGASAGAGTLFVTTRRVVWVPGAAAAAAGAVSLGCAYRQIAMHAVSREDEASQLRPCVYLQLDEGSEAMGDDGEGDEDDEAELAPELRLVPADAAQVEALFQSLCDNSALNPDSDAEEEGGAQLFFDEAEVLAGLPEEQRAALLAARAEGALDLGGEGGEDDLDELMGDDPQRFEDDEDESDVAPPAAAAGANGTAG